MNFDSILTIALQLIAIFMAIVLHEVAHGYMALRLGDPTARTLGRLTLNPLAHIDPIGTILVPLVSIILSGMAFGWAKPVPINPRYFRNPFRGMLFVALAGPGTNIALALGATVIGRLFLTMVPRTFNIANPSFGGNLVIAFFTFLAYLVIFNLFFAVLNMIPIPPLDGGRIAVGLLPTHMAERLASIEPYGMLVIVVLFIWDPIGLWQHFLGPFISGILSLMLKIAGIG